MATGSFDGLHFKNNFLAGISWRSANPKTLSPLHTPLAALWLASSSLAFSQESASFRVSITVDASKPMGPPRPIWRYFGADEPNYAYMKDGKKLLAELGELKPKGVYFRAHNLLTTGDGTPALKWGSTNAYTEDAVGHPIYDWTPEAKYDTIYLGWTYPPKD